MAHQSYLAALTKARQDLEALRRQRQQIDLEIARLTQVIASLKPIAEPGDDDAAEQGLTDSVRATLRASEQALLPTEVRDRLGRSGFDIAAYSQFLASLHAVLKRLVKSGEAVEVDASDGARYWWSLNGNKPIVIPPGTITITAPPVTAISSQPLGTSPSLLDLARQRNRAPAASVRVLKRRGKK